MSVTQATFAATLVDEWVRAGLTDAVVCPGSRSTPLALALAARPEIRLHVRLDERGAGFFAVGLALASGRPAVVCTTSGTAAAELHAAVVEADLARVPLLVCTADRPPELHGVGAPQTIAQRGLYGAAVRWSSEPGVAEEATRATWRSLGARAVAEALRGPLGPGPVHLNLAFREPLVDEPGPLPPGRAGGAPYHCVRNAAAPTARRLVAGWQGRRGVVVAGAGAGPPEYVLALGERLGWPVLADPRSGCRRRHPNVVAAADGLARSGVVRRALCPEVALVLGAPWASRALATLVAGAAEVVAVDPWWRWADPERLVGEVVRAEVEAWLEAAVAALGPHPGGTWLGRWQAVEAAAQGAVDAVLGDLGDAGLTEPGLARRLYAELPGDCTVVASSSMPVRDLEWFAPPVATPPRVLANRGANGIDGVCSTALGVAAAASHPVVGVLGDLAFLHDCSALVRLGSSVEAGCTLVVVDNGGGGIFDLLPHAGVLDRARFELLFGTPPATDVVAVAAGFGATVADVGTPGDLADAVAAMVGQRSLAVVRARVPGRAENAALHDRLQRAMAGAAEAALG